MGKSYKTMAFLAIEVKLAISSLGLIVGLLAFTVLQKPGSNDNIYISPGITF